jgi:pantetheine-phosphate adenylyltransferase
MGSFTTKALPLNRQLAVSYRFRPPPKAQRCNFLTLPLELPHRMPSDRGQPVTAVYPGSFDPVTNGHLDLIARGAMIFERLIVAVTHNLEKTHLFDIDERIEMLETVTFDWKNVQIEMFDGLLVEYAKAKNAQVIMRGIRAVSDYEYELQMAMMNRKLEPSIETVFLLPGEPYSYLSSRLVREVAKLGGSMKGLVPQIVEERLRAKFRVTV